MQQYIGTKVIEAEPMCKEEFENGSQPVFFTAGFKVKYADGYVSWSPLKAFQDAYQESGKLNFGHALHYLKQGKKVARSGWNGKGMWLLLVPGTNNVRPVAGTPYSKAGIIEETNINPHIDMFTAQGDMQPGWLASQTDMLAEDWCVVE